MHVMVVMAGQSEDRAVCEVHTISSTEPLACRK